MNAQTTINQSTIQTERHQVFFNNIYCIEFIPDKWLRKYVTKIVIFSINKAVCNSPIKALPNGLIEWTILDQSSTLQVESSTHKTLYKSFLIGIFDCKTPLQIQFKTNSDAFRGISVFFTINGIQSLTSLYPIHFKNRVVKTNALAGCFQAINNKTQELRKLKQQYTVLYQFVKNRLSSKQQTGTLPHCFPHHCYCTSNISAKDLALEEKISYRTLNRHFHKQIGFTPKEYLKILRFDATLSAISNSLKFNWGELLTEYGYYDQAHFIREFKKLTGTTPCNWQKDHHLGFYFNRTNLFV